MDERELRHKLANLQAALNLITRVASDPKIAPDRKEMAEDRCRQIKREIQHIETQLSTGR